MSSQAPLRDDQEVTPWTVKSKNAIKYDKLVDQFGLKLIDEALLARFERLTGKPAHPWLRRGIIYCHQDLDKVLDHFEAGKPIYLYTGRGPSNDMHLGHMVPFHLTKYLQDAFNCPLVIQMSDEEKFYFKDNLTMEQAEHYMAENAKDIIACGFNPKKTFIFSQFEYGGVMHRLSARLMKLANVNQFNKTYGFNEQSKIGHLYWPIQQIAPAFADSFPHIFGNKTGKDALCLVPMAIDQSPYFRCARDYADELGYMKPAMICGKFLPSLLGEHDKMSSTGDSVNATMFLNSTLEQISQKIRDYAFSGGGATLKEHREKGANLEVDMSFRYLQFFEDTDAELDKIAADYGAGRLTTGEVKQKLVEKLKVFFKRHQESRALVTDAVLADFMAQ